MTAIEAAIPAATAATVKIATAEADHPRAATAFNALETARR